MIGMFAVELTFYGVLATFLRRGWRENGDIVRRTLAVKTAVKDVIEACGVPHPEVDLIVVTDGEDGGNPRAVDFAWAVQAPTRMHVYGVPAPADVLPHAPRLQGGAPPRFVADGHLGKLARNLRLLGLDTAYERDADDPRLLEIMVADDRVLLTRDRPLLMHGIVRHGYCPRSDESEEQTREVLRRFGLKENGAGLAPFCRCLHCNGLLETVDKSEVLAPLAAEPLTLRYYDEFRRCPGCQRIYWPGTHTQKLASLVARLLGEG